MHLLFLCFISFIAVTINVTGEKDVKRLLLNDPDVVNDRLNRMENMLAILNKTVKQQSLSIQQQVTINQQQATTIQQQAASLQQHSTTIQQQASSIQQQATTIQLQRTEIRQLQSTQGNTIHGNFRLTFRKLCKCVFSSFVVFEVTIF